MVALQGDVLGVGISYIQLHSALGWDPGVIVVLMVTHREGWTNSLFQEPGVSSYKPYIPFLRELPLLGPLCSSEALGNMAAGSNHCWEGCVFCVALPCSFVWIVYLFI